MDRDLRGGQSERESSIDWSSPRRMIKSEEQPQQGRRTTELRTGNGTIHESVPGGVMETLQVTTMGNAATVGLGATVIGSNRSSRAASPCRPTETKVTNATAPVSGSRQSPPNSSTRLSSRAPDEQQRPSSASNLGNTSFSPMEHHQKSASLTRNQSPSHMRRSRERDRVRQAEMLDGSSGEFHFQIGDVGYTDESQLLDDSQGGGGVSGTGSTTMNEDLDGGLFYPSQSQQQQHQQQMQQQQQQSTPSGERTLGRINSCQALDRLNTKIACTKESIRKEQTSRDGELRKSSLVDGD